MIHSPDNKHYVALEMQGEVRFGPAYFTLSINGRHVKDKLFGKEICWAEDSKYFAAMEMINIDQSRPPLNRAVLFDIIKMNFSVLETVDDGFSSDFAFKNGFFYYKQKYLRIGKIVELEVDPKKIDNWSKL